ncbi:MAG TPA: hypothetical protein VI259_07420 [Gemmatimonadaceae bacterium]
MPSPSSTSLRGRRVYVANGAGNRITIVDATTGQVTLSVDVGTRPWGIALSADGSRLYTADGRSNRVSVIETKTGVVARHARRG